MKPGSPTPATDFGDRRTTRPLATVGDRRRSQAAAGTDSGVETTGPVVFGRLGLQEMDRPNSRRVRHNRQSVEQSTEEEVEVEDSLGYHDSIRAGSIAYGSGGLVCWVCGIPCLGAPTGLASGERPPDVQGLRVDRAGGWVGFTFPRTHVLIKTCPRSGPPQEDWHLLLPLGSANGHGPSPQRRAACGRCGFAEL